jgi:hypothetical protein
MPERDEGKSEVGPMSHDGLSELAVSRRSETSTTIIDDARFKS